MSELMTLPRPVRIQRKRSKGWRMPPNTVSVCRSGVFGNPFIVNSSAAPGTRSGVDRWNVPTAADAVECFRLMCVERGGEWLDFIRTELKGKNLACFCPLDAPCHADILLRIANEEKA